MKLKGWLLLTGLLATVIALPFATYPLSYQPQSASRAALDDAHETWDYIHFSPSGESKGNVIYYPGGLVHPHSYAYFGKLLAMRGYDVFLTKPLFHLQIIHPEQGRIIMSDYPSSLPWFIGGHSLGGTAAAIWAHQDMELFSGLFFLASYPADAQDFSLSSLKIFSLKATLDSVMNDQTYIASQRLFNSTTTHYEVLEGGNHSQFGDYGFQRGDTPATISLDEQHEFVVDALSAWMEN